MTPREREVLEELRKGVTNKQIASRLTFSEQTVKNHVSRILSKFYLSNRKEIYLRFNNFPDCFYEP